MYKYVFILLLPLYIAGCFGHVSYPDQAVACLAGSKFPWDQQQHIQIDTKKGINDIQYFILDVFDKQVVYDDRQNYWVQVRLDNSLKSEMDYEPDQAYIMTQNRVVHADSKIYLPEPNKRLPGQEALPINRDIPRGQTLFIKFPVRKPAYDDQWQINFGEVKVDGKSIPFPSYKLCQRPGVSEFYRYKGAF